MANFYQRKTTGPKNGTRTTVTRGSDGSIRTTRSFGPKWDRTSESFKDGRVRTTKSQTIDGFGTMRTSSLSPSLNSYRKRSRSRSTKKFTKWEWYVFLFYAIILLLPFL